MNKGKISSSTQGTKTDSWKISNKNWAELKGYFVKCLSLVEGPDAQSRFFAYLRATTS